MATSSSLKGQHLLMLLLLVLLVLALALNGSYASFFEEYSARGRCVLMAYKRNDADCTPIWGVC